MSRRLLVIEGLFLWTLAFTREASACSVCFGNPNSKTTQGLFMAMYLLLGVVTVVLSGIAMTAWTWARRAKTLETERLKGSF